MPHSHRFATAFGACSLEWDETGVTGLRLPNENPNDAPVSAEPDRLPLPPELARLVERMQRHLAGAMQDFVDTPFAWATVTPFQQAVYRATLAVGPGRTATYGEIAVALGEDPRTSSRAIAAALGANPWPLLVPCHRIVGAGDRMTGFSAPGGIRTKVRLLALEGAQLLAE